MPSQLSVGREELLRIPRVMLRPDDVADAGVGRTGRSSIALRKRIGDHHEMILEFREKRSRLALKTMYIRENKAGPVGGRPKRFQVKYSAPHAASPSIIIDWDDYARKGKADPARQKASRAEIARYLRDQIDRAYYGKFREEDHPRNPAGSKKGGEFTKKPSASRGEMAGASRIGKGKDAMVVLESGEQAPEWITPNMIPPAWTDVRVALDSTADVLVTARDQKGRSKIVYSDSFSPSSRRFDGRANTVSSMHSAFHLLRPA